VEEYLQSSFYGTVSNVQRHHLDPKHKHSGETSTSTELDRVSRGTRAPASCMQQVRTDLVTGSDRAVQPKLLYVQYGRYLCSAHAGNLLLLTPHTAGAAWSVPWLNMLSSDAAYSVKKIDAALQKASARGGETEHSRRQRLLRLRGGNTKSDVYNSITRELYERGGVMNYEKLVHWIFYCVFELGSVTQAIQYTYTVLAAHSSDHFDYSAGQVSLFIHALDDVIKVLLENMSVYNGSVDKFDHCVATLLVKHAVNV